MGWLRTSFVASRLVPVLAAALLAAGCSSTADPVGADEEREAVTETGTDTGDDGERDDEVVVVQTTRVPTMEPTTAEALEISVDGDGRPYEVRFDPGSITVEERFATVLEIDERLLLVDGEVLWSEPTQAVRTAEGIRFRGADRLRLNVLWAVENDGGTGERPIGVRLTRPGAEVESWGERSLAFSAAAELGLITVPAAAERVIAAFEAEEPSLMERPLLSEPVVIDDLDDRPGRETVVLGLGAGGERFQATTGLDADGQLVGLVVLDADVPWRLVVAEGEPPPDVTQREQQLIDCIEGRRLVDQWGHCI